MGEGQRRRHSSVERLAEDGLAGRMGVGRGVESEAASHAGPVGETNGMKMVIA